MTDAEKLIETLQQDMADAKVILRRMTKNADSLSATDYVAGKHAAAADGMIFAGRMRAIHGTLVEAHGHATVALLVHYPDSMTRGPGR